MRPHSPAVPASHIHAPSYRITCHRITCNHCAQGIFQGLYFGVGQGLGALLGGLLMQRHGGRAMFAQASAITLAAWAACAAAERAALGGGGGSWRGAALWRPRAGPGGAITRGDYGRITSKASGPDLSHMRPAAAEPV